MIYWPDLTFPAINLWSMVMKRSTINDIKPEEWDEAHRKHMQDIRRKKTRSEILNNIKEADKRIRSDR